jgi:hypothetical protein
VDRYIIRPNEDLMGFSDQFLRSHLAKYPRTEGWSPETHPPPESAICVHIRHGDKGYEMK